MSSLAAIEVSCFPNGRAPVELVESAYRASRRGRIILLLDGIDPAAIDAMLEPLVPTMRLTIPGILYVDAEDAASVAQAVSQSCSIFTAVGGRLSHLPGSGQVHDLAEASAMLARLCRPTRLAEMKDDQTSEK
jgi:hypothetical protein